MTGASEAVHPGSRVAIIGAGHVGATAAYALMLRALFEEIVLIDSDPNLAAAEAADLSDANALARPARIWAGTYLDAASAAIAVITAGAATVGDQPRLAVARASGEIVGDCVGRLMAEGFDGIILVASNPVDLMALVAQRRSRLPPARVIGTGTLLDTSRLQQALAGRLAIAPAAVAGLVVGEHGDSEVVAFSTLRVAGLTLDQATPPDTAIDRAALATTVRDSAYAIIAGKGYTSFGVATAIVRICEAIIRNERSILPVSTLLDGPFGIAGIYLSLPCVVGAAGIVRVLEPALNEAEVAGLQASAAVIAEALEAIASTVV